MLGPNVMTFQDGADLEQTKVLNFLCIGKTQEAHHHTGPPMSRLGGINSFIDAKSYEQLLIKKPKQK